MAEFCAPLIAAELLTNDQDAGFWLVVMAFALSSLAALVAHFGIVRRWRTGTVLDRLFAWRREVLTRNYLEGSGHPAEQHGLFVLLPSSLGCALLAVAGLLLKIGGADLGWMGWAAAVLFFASVWPAIVVIRRSRVGPPERVKPSWLRQEERRLEAAGQIMRYGRGWVRVREKPTR